MIAFAGMRKLVDAASRDEARRLVDGLLVEDIEAEARGDDDREVWVLDDDALAAAREFVDRFARGECEDVGKRAEQKRRQQERDAADARQRTVNLGRKVAPGTGFGIVTTGLIVASVFVMLVGYLSDSSGTGIWGLTIDHWSALEPFERVREGEVWRLVTPIFLHFGLLHLGFNMLWTHRLGGQVEHQHGSLAMVGLVLACALAGNVGQYLVSGPAFGGMSGVVYGLFGFVWMHARYNRSRAYVIGGRETIFVMLWFVGCATGIFGPIANVGHAGGLVVGLLAGLPPYVRHLRAKGTTPDFAEGSWADVQLTGFGRFRKRVLAPYVPLWFLALAAAVIAIEQADFGTDAPYRREACEEYANRIADCFQALPDQPRRAAFIERLETVIEPVSNASADVTESELACAEALPVLEQVATEFGCGKTD